MCEIVPEIAAREHLLMALRLHEGLDLQNYRARWKAVLSPGRIAAFEQGGFLENRAGRLKTTPRGRLVLNHIVAELAS